MAYYTYVDNMFTYPNAPIVVDVGVDFTAPATTRQYIKRILPNNIKVLDAFHGSELLVTSNNTVQVSRDGSYSLLIYTNEDATPFTYKMIFSFFCYNNVQRLNTAYLVKLIGQELPSLLNPVAPYMKSIIFGYASVFATIYEQLYYLYYNTVESLGVEDEFGRKGYNSDLEYVYIGVNKFLENAVYPAPLLQTLMNVKTQTGITPTDIAIILSRIYYQFTGNEGACSVVWNQADNRYDIFIWYVSTIPYWILGTSILGTNTILGSPDDTAFFWILYTIAQRLMPVTTKYKLIPLLSTDFVANYYVDEVGVDIFYNPAIKYDAYRVVNNNVSFNTQGFFKR